MNVLATRPSEHNADWQALLENAGFTALPCPVIEIVEVSEAKYLQAVKQKILALDEYYALIFVSRNAVHYGLNWIDKYWPQLPVDLMWFAVGKQTAKCRRASCFSGHLKGERGGSRLLRVVSSCKTRGACVAQKFRERIANLGCSCL